MSGMVLGPGKIAISKRQPLPSMRSEQCVVKLTTAVVMIRTASIYSALNADPCLESSLQLLSILRRKQLRSKEVRKLTQGDRQWDLTSDCLISEPRPLNHSSFGVKLELGSRFQFLYLNTTPLGLTNLQDTAGHGKQKGKEKKKTTSAITSKYFVDPGAERKTK